MKFTKQQVLEKIKAEMGQTAQISERSISESIDTLLFFASEEMELDDFVQKVKPVFTSIDGNYRKDVADKVKELEDKFRKPVEPKPNEPKPAEPANDEPSWFKAYRETSEQKYSDLEKKLADAEKAKTVEMIKATAVAKAKETYPENVVKTASLNYNFAAENAETDFINICNEVGKNFGVAPVVSGKQNEPSKPDFNQFKKVLADNGQIPKEADK